MNPVIVRKTLVGHIQPNNGGHHAWALDTDPYGPLLQSWNRSKWMAREALQVLALTRGYDIYWVPSPSLP